MDSEERSQEKEKSVDLQSASTNPVGKKLNKIIEMKLDSDREFIDSVKLASSFFMENTLSARRRLRSDIEKQGIDINRRFLSSLSDVIAQLDDAYRTVSDMHAACASVNERIRNVKSQTQNLIDATAILQRRSDTLAMQYAVADCFVKHFQLTDAEIQALHSNDRSVVLSDRFFVALARAKKIHTDCAQLVRAVSHGAGLEIMSSMSAHLDAAYEVLRRCAVDECRALLDESPEIGRPLQRAMRALAADRPTLFAMVLDEYAQVRRAALVRAFIDALTRSGPSHNGEQSPASSVKPIELHAHDPVRYLSDQLAFIHQCAVTEQEALRLLLGSSEAGVQEASNSDGVPSNAVLLRTVVDGVCRLLRTRCEQALSAVRDILVLFRVKCVLQFYAAMFAQLLGEREQAAAPSASNENDTQQTPAADASQLVRTVRELDELSWRMFVSALQVETGRLVDETDGRNRVSGDREAPVELSPPPAFVRVQNAVGELLKMTDTALAVGDSHVLKQRLTRLIVAHVVDPLVSLCALSASGLAASQMAVYLINCFSALRQTLAVFEYTDTKLEMLDAQIAAHLDTLVAETVAFTLNRTALGLAYERLVVSAPCDPQAVAATPEALAEERERQLAALALLDHTLLRGALARFEQLLSAPDSFLLPHVHLVQSSRMRDTVRQRAFGTIATFYSILYDAIHAASQSGQEKFAQLVPLLRPPAQVTQLLA